VEVLFNNLTNWCEFGLVRNMFIELTIRNANDLDQLATKIRSLTFEVSTIDLQGA
jgi:hypothetical protein